MTLSISFFCHARKNHSANQNAAVSFEFSNPQTGQTVRHQAEVSPTINWVASSTTDDSVTVAMDLPVTWLNTVLNCTITVENNDVLICGYGRTTHIVSNPLWDGQLGPYDISGHDPNGGTLGNGSLQIYEGQTVTFDCRFI